MIVGGKVCVMAARGGSGLQLPAPGPIGRVVMVGGAHERFFFLCLALLTLFLFCCLDLRHHHGRYLRHVIQLGLRARHELLRSGHVQGEALAEVVAAA